MPLPPPHSVEVGLLEEDRGVKVGLLEEEVVPTRGAERREEREEGAEEDMAQQRALVGSGMERSRASAWVVPWEEELERASPRRPRGS